MEGGIRNQKGVGIWKQRRMRKRMRSKSSCSWASWSVSAGNESKKWPTPNDCHLTIATSLCGLIIIYRLITKMMMMVVIGLRLMMAVILTTMTMTFMQSRIQAIWRCVLMDLCPCSEKFPGCIVHTVQEGLSWMTPIFQQPHRLSGHCNDMKPSFSSILVDFLDNLIKAFHWKWSPVYCSVKSW